MFAASAEWTLEKQRALDWSNLADVVAHGFLFITLVDMHPKLAALVCDSPSAFAAEKRAYHEDPAAAIRSMHARGLFVASVPPAQRWCAGCRQPGHTLTACPSRSSKGTDAAGSAAVAVAGDAAAATSAAGAGVKPPSSGVFHRFRQHCRAAIVEEKSGAVAGSGGPQQNQRGGGGGGQSFPGQLMGPPIPGWGQKFGGQGWVALGGPNTLVAGRIRNIDLVNHMADIDSGGATVPAMLTRARFGLRKPCEGEPVQFRIEKSGPRMRAVDITLDRTSFIISDIEFMLRECGFGGSASSSVSAAALAAASETTATAPAGAAGGAGQDGSASGGAPAAQQSNAVRQQQALLNAASAASGGGGKAQEPMTVLRFILQNHEDWTNLLRAVAGVSPKLQELFAFAIVCVVAFRRNMFPIHNSIMRLVVRLLCIRPAAGAAAAPSKRGGDAAADAAADGESGAAKQVPVFVPDIVLAAIPEGTADDMETRVGHRLMQAVEHANTLQQLAQFFFVLRVYNFRTPDVCAQKLSGAIAAAAEHFRKMTHFQNPRIVESKLQTARELLAAAAAPIPPPAGLLLSSSNNQQQQQQPLTSEDVRAEIMRVSVQSPLPTAAEILRYGDFFASANLPQLTHSRTQFRTQQELVSAHLALLRADLCEATARTIHTAFFAPPGQAPAAAGGATAQHRKAESTLKDLARLHTYSGVRFVGRTCSRHFEACNAALIEVAEDPRPELSETEQAWLTSRSPFDAGRVFFLATNTDPKKITEDDIFWLVVQTPEESPLHRRNIVAVTPVSQRQLVQNVTGKREGGGMSAAAAVHDHDDSTASSLLLAQEERLVKLQRALERNERQGRAAFASRMLETNMFLFGYEPVFRALSSYLIPTCPVPLPMAAEFFGPAPQPSGAYPVAPGVVPPHYRDGFARIVDDIRARNRLDAGQDEAMRSLLTRRLMTVWGSPGTGKSFTGCRIVEAYVRYKHALRSGQLLRDVDPMLLPSTRDADLNPSMGPIVVITYKNHALDEFLLDLKRSGLWGSAAAGTADSFSRNSVVRVGSGSTEAELAEINLSHLVDGTPSPDKAASYFRTISHIRQAETLAAAIRDLEGGRLRPAVVAQWLSPEQRERFFPSYMLRNDERAAEQRVADFLAGKDYVGPAEPPVPPQRMYPETVRSVILGASSHLFAGKNAGSNNSSNSAADGSNSGNSNSGGGGGAATEAQMEEAPEYKPIAETVAAAKDDDDAAAATSDAAASDGGSGSKKKAKGAAEPTADDELELNSESMRESTLQAIKRELRSDKKRRQFPHDCGLPSLVSREALALALGTNFESEEAAAAAAAEQERKFARWAGLQSIWSLGPQERHDFVTACVRRDVAGLARQYLGVTRGLELATSLQQHVKGALRLELLRTADVVGITTTGCAINQDLLRSIEPQVIVVEEAAEVLESQLLACLPESLRQIVLIGDHFQLQPATETYEYEKENHMNISLFERLVQSNGTSRNAAIQLVEQRRMRPEICDMIRNFYLKEADTLNGNKNSGAAAAAAAAASAEDDAAGAGDNARGAAAGSVVIEDHPSVRTRFFVDRLGRQTQETVPGLVKNVFFWNHNTQEQEANVGLSIINLREVELAVMLVQHLLANKLHPTSVTVITPYLGQRRAITAALADAGVEPGVRVSTVDRFQGDEADVIILSLVRTKKMTDFLRYRNRLIVAASRARYAMVFIGNSTLLRNSPHWSQVLDGLQAHGCVGNEMPVSWGLGRGMVTARVKSNAREWPAQPKEEPAHKVGQDS